VLLEPLLGTFFGDWSAVLVDILNVGFGSQGKVLSNKIDALKHEAEPTRATIAKMSERVFRAVPGYLSLTC